MYICISRSAYLYSYKIENIKVASINLGKVLKEFFLDEKKKNSVKMYIEIRNVS